MSRPRKPKTIKLPKTPRSPRAWRDGGVIAIISHAALNRVLQASPSQKALIQFQARSAQAAPSHVISAVRTCHTTSEHKLRIDLSLERLTEAGRHI